MIFKIFWILAFLIFSAVSVACEIHVPGNILVLGESTNFVPSLAQTSCDENSLKEVNNTLNSVEGKITSFQFSEILKNKNVHVLIQPPLIQVQHLKHLVREKLMLPSGVQMKSSEAVNSQNYISLIPGDTVEVECMGCLFGAQQALNVKIRGSDGSIKNLAVKADFKKMINAYKYTSFLPAFSEIPVDGLREELIEAVPHTDIITNLDHLKFYKLNKPVRAGDLLRKQDLNAISLVKAGVKTDVIIENDLVMLKTSGISRSNGSLGEMVEIFHPQKNKKFFGKVIDINKVLVEL